MNLREASFPMHVIAVSSDICQFMPLMCPERDRGDEETKREHKSPNAKNQVIVVVHRMLYPTLIVCTFGSRTYWNSDSAV